MKNIIFEFGHYYFLQLLGAAIGTVPPLWSCGQLFTLHTTSGTHSSRIMYTTFSISRDSLMILICLEYGHTMQQQTGQLSTMMLTTSVFSRGTLRINNPLLWSTTLILLPLSEKTNCLLYLPKKINLHLYIPPMSAHPSWCIKGTIFGLIDQYHAQNTYR